MRRREKKGCREEEMGCGEEKKVYFGATVLNCRALDYAIVDAIAFGIN